MALFMVEKDLVRRQNLVMDQGSQSHATKIERRIVEKNRRNQMKILYSDLNSLLPPNNSKEIQTLPDQIDDAINHIKSLESKLSKLQEKKKSLSGTNSKTSTRKRSYSCTNSSFEFDTTETLKSPQIEIHEIGPIFEVVLVTGLDNHFIFYDLIRVFNEERADIVNAKFSVAGDSIFHEIHAEIEESIFGAVKLSERLKRFVNGSTSDVDLQQEWWEDFEIQPEMFELN